MFRNFSFFFQNFKQRKSGGVTFAGVNKVSDMKLVAIDCVSDPSCPKAFVNGILESKSFVINDDGKFEESYDKFEESLETLPRKEVDTFLRARVLEFLNKIGSNV